MSKEALAKVVQRAISDASFRRQLSSDTAGALRGFDLTPDEVSALRAGDAGRLSTLGVDQRMSKAFVIGGAAAATRMAQSDLTAGTPGALDDGSAGARTIIPHDPESTLTADLDGSAAASRSALNDDPDGFLAANADASGGVSGTSTVRAGDDWKFAGRVAPEGASTRTGDDWKYADKSVAQGSVAPVEGSPEADAAAQQSSGGGMANYPAHHGLAGPSQVGSARAGDDWARSARIDDSGRIGSARLDEKSADSSGASAINDDPDGFLAANANADLSGSVTRPNVNDDPDGFLAANANADFSGGTSRGDGTAFVDDSEGYLTKVGYDASAASPNAKATWGGDENAGPASNADDEGGASPNATEDGPISH